MGDIEQNLYSIIQDFLSRKINAEVFEKKYSRGFDLEEDLEFESEIKREYYSEIRLILERFTPYRRDLMEHPDFYIDELRLQKEVLEITSVYNAKSAH